MSHLRICIAALALTCLAGQPAAAQDPKPESKATIAAASKSASADAKAAKSGDPKKAANSAQAPKAGTSAAGNNIEGALPSLGIEDQPVDGPAAGADTTSPAPSATDKWLPAGLAILLAALFAGLVGWLLNRKIKALEVGFDHLRERIRSQTNQLSELRETGHQDSFGRPAAGSSGERQDDQARSASPPPPAPREPEPAKPEPRVSRLPERLDQIRQELSALILSPGLRSTEYDAALARFGTVYGIQILADGSNAKLIPTESDTGRRLSAIHLADEGVAVILPSSRYVKEFAMTFKESLEAGSDVKLVFDCRVDGSATLKLQRPAHARVDSDMYLGELSRGELAGYVG